MTKLYASSYEKYWNGIELEKIVLNKRNSAYKNGDHERNKTMDLFSVYNELHIHIVFCSQ